MNLSDLHCLAAMVVLTLVCLLLSLLVLSGSLCGARTRPARRLSSAF